MGLNRLRSRKRSPPRNASETKLRLEGDLDRLVRAIEFFTFLVAIGLVTEYVPDIVVMVLDHTFDRHILGGLLITLGVAGELFAGLLASQIEGELRTTNALIIGETTERAAKAEQAVAEANLSRVLLERWAAVRNISREQGDAIAESLARFAGQLITIRAFPVQSEPIGFANLIFITLRQAGWKARLLESHLFTSPGGAYCSGFSLMSTPDEQSIEAGRALVLALAQHVSEGGLTQLGHLPNPENPRLELVVQEKHRPPKAPAPKTS